MKIRVLHVPLPFLSCPVHVLRVSRSLPFGISPEKLVTTGRLRDLMKLPSPFISCHVTSSASTSEIKVA
jgi:hypothetical protein